MINFKGIQKTVQWLVEAGEAEDGELSQQTLAAVRAAAAGGSVIFIESAGMPASLREEVLAETRVLSGQTGVKIPVSFC